MVDLDLYRDDDVLIEALRQHDPNNQDIRLFFRQGSISHSLAKAIKDHTKKTAYSNCKWELNFFTCYPADDDACQELRTAFSTNIFSICLFLEANSSEQTKAMIKSVLDPDSNADGIKRIRAIKLWGVTFRHDTATILRRYLLTHVNSLRHLEVGNCKFVGDGCSFFRTFNEMQYNPKQLVLSHMVASDFGQDSSILSTEK